MSDINTPPQVTPQVDPPTPAPVSAAEAPSTDKQQTRFAIYDLTYLRYLGDVHDTKAKANKQAKDRKVAKYEIREV